jgi:hypothetical protein
MLSEVQSHAVGRNIPYPYVGWHYPKIQLVHEKLYPESRLRRINRILRYVFFINIGCLALWMFLPVILRPMFQ